MYLFKLKDIIFSCPKIFSLEYAAIHRFIRMHMDGLYSRNIEIQEVQFKNFANFLWANDSIERMYLKVFTFWRAVFKKRLKYSFIS